MPMDPKAQAMFAAVKNSGMPDFSELTPQQARSMTAEMSKQMRLPAREVGNVVDRGIPGPAGDIAVRIYTPKSGGVRPLIVFFHGGGWVLCDLDSHDSVCRDLCADAEAVVVSVDYRLAPEHKFPAAPDDCVAATRWAAAHAKEIGADGSRIVVAGDSAGGNLAAAVALRLRDEGGPPLAGQLLIYPVTDSPYNDKPSLLENADAFGLTRRAMHWFWDHYVTESHRDHPHAAPLLAKDLRGLPPALVIAAECDPLRDEAAQYADRLRAAGVPTVYTLYGGMIHGFYSFGAAFEQTQYAQGQVTAWLRTRLNQPAAA